MNDYDSTIAYVDSEIGRALGHVKKAGLYDESLIVILADHGEAMYEHKAWGHSSNVFEETTHVPLLVKFPASMNLERPGPKGRPADGSLSHPDGPVRTARRPSRQEPARGHREACGSTTRAPSSQSITEVAQFGMRWRHWYYIISLITGRERVRSGSPIP